MQQLYVVVKCCDAGVKVFGPVKTKARAEQLLLEVLERSPRLPGEKFAIAHCIPDIPYTS